MKVFDLHSDIFTDIAFRRANGERKVFERIHLPKLQKAGITGMIGVLWVEPIFKNKKKRFLDLVSYVYNDVQESSKVKLVTTMIELESHSNSDTFCLYIGIEGMTFLEDWDGQDDRNKVTSAIDHLDEKMVKHAIFSWNDTNFIATGSGNPEANHSGLSSLGEFTIQQFEKNHWIIDVSHLDQRSFWGVAQTCRVPFLASHSNAYTICPHERNLTDEQIKAIAASNGLVGVNAYGSFVDQSNPTRSKVIDHICYIADLVGIDYVGFGFDFVDYLQAYNLGSDMSNMTKGLESAEKIPDLLDEMIQRGFSLKDLEKVAHKNFYRFLLNLNLQKV